MPVAGSSHQLAQRDERRLEVAVEADRAARDRDAASRARSFSSGSAGRSSRATGCISRASAALSVRNGRWTGNDSMPAWNAGCERAIVSLSDSGSREIASNVMAGLGEEVGLRRRPAAPRRARRRRARGRSGPSRVRRSASVARDRARGGRRAAAARSIALVQRTCRAPPARCRSPGGCAGSPRARRPVEDAREVVDLDRAAIVCSTGKTWPSCRAVGGVPRTISRYFRPSGERGRIVNVVSTGSRRPRPPRARRGSPRRPCRPRSAHVRISRTKPTRTPPSRTSEPLADRRRVVGPHLHLERWARTAVPVGVVGEEDRDDRHEHGHGADQGRARDERGGRAAGHGPSR